MAHGASTRNSIATDVLIVGAGPYGLSLSAQLRSQGIDHVMVGEPMGFWKRNMPPGMFLRSSWDWHLDPEDEWTIERYCVEHGMSRQAITPFALSDYLAYVDWFQQHAGLTAEPWVINRLARMPEGGWRAWTADGQQIDAGAIVLALGFASFAVDPPEVFASLSAARFGHTLDLVALDGMCGQRVLILGGRQSAFEWAALLTEAGADRVDIVHRHPSPAFAEADWSWVTPLVERTVDDPGWYRNLTDDEREAIATRLWGEGRLKIEPWLEPRLKSRPVTVWPETEVESIVEQCDGLTVTLSNGQLLETDQIILATGYKPQLDRVTLLEASGLLGEIRTTDGLPDLDFGFQTSLPSLYVTSMLAVRDFGPFFAFTVAARASAIVIGNALHRQLG